MDRDQAVPKVEYYPHQEFGWQHSQEHFHGYAYGEFGFPPMDRLFEYDPSLFFSFQTSYNLPNFHDFRELEDHFVWIDQNLPSCNGFVSVVNDFPDSFDHVTATEQHLTATELPFGGGGFSDNILSVMSDGFSDSCRRRRRRRHEDGRKLQQSSRSKMGALEMEDIKKHFNVPITRAAKELNVGLTVLKKRCRQLNITRWPHRKIKSLKALISNAKELGFAEEIEMLEEHKRMVEKQPEMELTEKAKKLRQACFKANYKRKRALLHAPFP